jgi:hypothetical protein
VFKRARFSLDIVRAVLLFLLLAPPRFWRLDEIFVCCCPCLLFGDRGRFDCHQLRRGFWKRYFAVRNPWLT